MRPAEVYRRAEQLIAEAARSEWKDLDLSRIGLNTLPDSIGQLTELQSLNLYANRLTSLPDSIGQLAQLEKLLLSNNRLATLPDSLGQITQLQSLDLSGNRLTTLPHSIGHLNQLQELHLINNQLAALPDSIGHLTQLQALSLKGNQLTSLPDSIGRLTQLEKLLLSNNQLTTLPDSTAQLTQLQRLDLSENQLTALPHSLGQITRLKELLLSENQLTALPHSFGRFTELQVLDLSSNQLTTLPGSLHQLECLTHLFLHDNPGLGLPAEALGPASFYVYIRNQKPKRPRDILDFYFRINPPSTGGLSQPPPGRPLLEARIIVVGDGAAGKTSLVRQVLHGEPASRAEASTRDVVIKEWPVSLRNTDVRVNIWDFGGQKQMHAAHPYFFTARTLYIVVAEARKDQQDRVDYWLKMVAKYGGNARALVVINKADGHAMALDRPKLLDRYRNNLPGDASQAFFATSCTEGTGIKHLRNAILRELGQMDQLWALWPAQWFKVKQSIIAMRHPAVQPAQGLGRLKGFFRPGRESNRKFQRNRDLELR